MQYERNTQTSDDAGLEALRRGAALIDHPGRTVLRLSGKDPVGMLNAILTNEVPKDANVGAYAALLNPKGRIQADLRVLKVPGGEALLVETAPEGAQAVSETLGRYAPFSRVGVEELSDWKVLGLYGPDAASVRDVGLSLTEHESAEVEAGGTEGLAVGVKVPVPGFDHLGPAGAIDALRERLIERGAVPAGPDAYETTRIAAGVPRFGADITPENFPGECGILERAVSFKKGCYPGQETVARMYYRGHPNRYLHRLVLEGPAPKPETEILQDGKRVGSVTSVAPLPVDGNTLALGYLSRKTDLDAPLRAGHATVRPLTLIGNSSR